MSRIEKLTTINFVTDGWTITLEEEGGKDKRFRLTISPHGGPRDDASPSAWALLKPDEFAELVDAFADAVRKRHESRPPDSEPSVGGKLR